MIISQRSLITFKQVSAWLLAFTVSLVLLNGCGSMHGNSMMQNPMQQPADFAFVSNSGTGTVSAFAISASGSLSNVSGSPFASGAGAEFMALDNIHKFLFVANQGVNTVSAFRINTGTGLLTPVSGSPFATGSTPMGVAVDPMGRFVFVANQNSNSVSVFSIDSASGALAPIAGSPFTGISTPFGLSVSPNGAFLFVSNADTNLGIGNTITTFAINSSTGTLSLAAAPVATSNPLGITSPFEMATDGKFLFVGNHMAESVVSFNVNATSGALTPASALPAPAAGCGVSCHHNPLRLTMDSTDKFVYWTNVQANTVSSFTINSNGSLAPVSEVQTGQHPFGLALTPGGNQLYVVNKMDNSISGFSVNPATGTISALNGFPVPEGNNAPTDIVIVARQ